jgi:hypothetical protein
MARTMADFTARPISLQNILLLFAGLEAMSDLFTPKMTRF